MPGDLGKQLCVPTPRTADPTSCFRARAKPPVGGGERGINAVLHIGATEAATKAASQASSASPAHRPSRRSTPLAVAPRRGTGPREAVRTATTVRPTTTWATGQPRDPVADTVRMTTHAATNDAAVHSRTGPSRYDRTRTSNPTPAGTARAKTITTVAHSQCTFPRNGSRFITDSTGAEKASNAMTSAAARKPMTDGRFPRNATAMT